MGIWKIAPALAAGNSVVLKPDEHSLIPLSRSLNYLLSGWASRVLNVVSGHGEEAGKALALHPDVLKIGFRDQPRLENCFCSMQVSPI